MPEKQDFPPDFDMSCRGLLPVRCEMLGNVIFVNFDPDGMPPELVPPETDVARED